MSKSSKGHVNTDGAENMTAAKPKPKPKPKATITTTKARVVIQIMVSDLSLHGDEEELLPFSLP
jgi:hypothetical protein